MKRDDRLVIPFLFMIATTATHNPLTLNNLRILLAAKGKQG